jgi:hypothetical protein
VEFWFDMYTNVWYAVFLNVNISHKPPPSQNWGGVFSISVMRHNSHVFESLRCTRVSLTNVHWVIAMGAHSHSSFGWSPWRFDLLLPIYRQRNAGAASCSGKGFPEYLFIRSLIFIFAFFFMFRWRPVILMWFSG